MCTSLGTSPELRALAIEAIGLEFTAANALTLVDALNTHAHALRGGAPITTIDSAGPCASVRSDSQYVYLAWRSPDSTLRGDEPFRSIDFPLDPDGALAMADGFARVVRMMANRATTRAGASGPVTVRLDEPIVMKFDDDQLALLADVLRRQPIKILYDRQGRPVGTEPREDD